MPYNAFISYSHAADGRLAPALQDGLQRLAKPWNRRRALNIFRDDTALSVSHALWSSIQTALDEAEWFIFLPSGDRSDLVRRHADNRDGSWNARCLGFRVGNTAADSWGDSIARVVDKFDTGQDRIVAGRALSADGMRVAAGQGKEVAVWDLSRAATDYDLGGCAPLVSSDWASHRRSFAYA